MISTSNNRPLVLILKLDLFKVVCQGGDERKIFVEAKRISHTGLGWVLQKVALLLPKVAVNFLDFPSQKQI